MDYVIHGSNDILLLEMDQTGEMINEFTFGGSDFSTLFLTAQTSVYSVETNVRGIAPGSR